MATSARANLLIQPLSLSRHIDQGEDGAVVGMTSLLRFYLAHIPHSLQAWRPQISAPGSHRLIDAEGFQAWARQLGLNRESRLVVWDTRYDATRLWWAFQRYGKTDVQVLDGGLQAWRRAPLPIQRYQGFQQQQHRPGNFQAEQGTRFAIAEADDILQSEMNPDVQLWDCRDLPEWNGHRRLKGAKKGGRIPWAKHLPWHLFHRAGRHDHRHIREDEIQEIARSHGMHPEKKHIFYCQSGVRSTLPIFSLYRLGWEPEALINYDGSWREWSQSDRRPWTRDT